MPYWVHVKETSATSGDEYADTRSAHTACAERNAREVAIAIAECVTPAIEYVVTFVATDDERAAWHERERGRFARGEYVRCPWYRDGYDVEGHFAHLSKLKPGLVAYTRSDADGCTDKQHVLKPISYLTRYFDGRFDAETVERYITQCAIENGALNFARTEDEIVAAYTDNPWQSCMKSEHTFSSSRMPVVAYADSDIAIATAGPFDGCTARAVVWPDKKRFGRTFGDCTRMHALLHAAGYEHGDLHGARIRAIVERGSYVVPYIDGVDFARVSDDGAWLVLDRHGDISTRSTSGLVAIPRSANTSGDEDEDDNGTLWCSHCNEDEAYDEGGLCRSCMRSTSACDDCGERHDYSDLTTDNDSTYCESCMQDRFTCEDCGSIYSHDDAHCAENGDGCFCDDCWSNTSAYCDVCEDRFNTREFSYRQERDRRARGVSELCDGCADHHRACSDCGIVFDTDDVSASSAHVNDMCLKCAIERMHAWAIVWRRLDLFIAHWPIEHLTRALDAVMDAAAVETAVQQ